MNKTIVVKFSGLNLLSVTSFKYKRSTKASIYFKQKLQTFGIL